MSAKKQYATRIDQRIRDIQMNLETLLLERHPDAESYEEGQIIQAVGEIIGSESAKAAESVAESMLSECSIHHSIRIETPARAFIERQISRNSPEGLPSFQDAVLSSLESLDSMPPSVIEEVEIGMADDAAFLRRKLINHAEMAPFNQAIASAIENALSLTQLPPEVDDATGRAMMRSFAKSAVEALVSRQGDPRSAMSDLPELRGKILSATSLEILENGSYRRAAPAEFAQTLETDAEALSPEGRSKALFAKLGI